MPEISGMIQQFLEGQISTIGRAPVIQSKNITENGTYTAPEGVDGFSPVVVNVPDTPPVIDSISIFGNGTYTAPEGIDGYSPIIVDVPSKIEITLNATSNGTYTPPEGYVYDSAIVNIASIGNVIANKAPIVNNRTLQSVSCELTQGKYYSIFYYDDYLYPRSGTPNRLGCTSFCRTASGTTEQRFLMDYNNTMKDLYCTDSSIYLKTKFDNDAVNCYVTVIEIDDSIISQLIPT